jgi:hypothetical protein
MAAFHIMSARLYFLKSRDGVAGHMAQPEYIQKLIDTYLKAQFRLVNLIAYKEHKGSVTEYQRSLLAQVKAEIAYLDEYAKQWATDTIDVQYRKGVIEAVNGLKGLGIEIAGFEAFSQLHTKAIGILTANTINDLTDANNFVGRVMGDAVRQAGLEATQLKIATGGTVRETQKLLAKKLIDMGIAGIRTKNGRMIAIAPYSELVARSTTREATNTATMNQLSYLGYDLVQMSSHATTCPVCSAYQGRVYSISGKDNRYPPLNAAFSGSHANIHPNCRHVLVPYIESLADHPEADRVFSNRPFDIPERDQEQLDAYNEKQAKKTQQRNDRDQYERYRLALGDGAPKTFSGFMASKRANSEKWNQMQQDYRDFNKEVKDLNG